MTHFSRFLLIAVSLTAIIILVAALSADEAVAQTGTSTATPSPALPAANRIDKLEEQVAALDKKMQKGPKDNWDKLGLASGFISGLLVALIGTLATYLYKRRETALMESENKRQAADEKAKLELAILSNKRGETQLEVERINREKEITISQTQTVRDMLPSLQSADPKTKEAALRLIAFLGNAELAASLSQLYGTDLGPVLQAIAGMAGATSETRRQASHALWGLGSKQEAVDSLVELAKDTKMAPAEQLSVAEGLEKFDEPEKARELQLLVLLNSRTSTDERSRVLTALKRPQYVEQAGIRLLEIARDPNAETSNRLAAIEALSQLEVVTEDAKAALSSILAEMVRSATAPADLNAINAAFKNLGLEQEATQLLWQISTDPEADITKRYAAIENLAKLGAEKDFPGLAEKRDEILRKLVNDPEVKANLRLAALRASPGTREEKLKILQDIIDSPKVGFVSRLLARGMVTSLNNDEITSKPSGENLLSTFWKSLRKKPETSIKEDAKPAPVAEEQRQPEASKAAD